MRRSLRALFTSGALFLALTACFCGEEADVSPRETREQAADEVRQVALEQLRLLEPPAAPLVTYAPVATMVAPVPPRFTAPLPTTLEGLSRWSVTHPPRSHVEDRVCAGDEEMLGRLITAAEAAEAGGASPEQVAEALGRAMAFCDPRTFCLPAARSAAGTSSAAAREVLWAGLRGCPRRLAATIVGAGGPFAGRELAEDGRPETPLDERVRGWPFDAADHLHQHPEQREQVKAALVACLDEGASYTRDRCLLNLARVDYPLAVARARALAPREGADPSTDVATWLRRFPEPGALEARLREAGLIGALPQDAALSVTPRGLLETAGRATTFDVETGMFPNGHDHLLRALAALAPGALPDAVFLEVPPVFDDAGFDEEERRARVGALADELDPETYHLVAWVDGKRHVAPAEDHGDWYDLDAVLAFLDAIARDRGSETRWTTLGTLDQLATVVAGPEQALRAAVADGLLGPGRADTARERGRAFEDRVMRELREDAASIE